METATLTQQDRDKMEKAVKTMEPVAKEIVKTALESTVNGKHGYILIMNILENYNANKGMKNLLIVSLLRAGYPPETMQHICSIEGIV